MNITKSFRKGSGLPSQLGRVRVITRSTGFGRDQGVPSESSFILESVFSALEDPKFETWIYYFDPGFILLGGEVNYDHVHRRQSVKSVWKFQPEKEQTVVQERPPISGHYYLLRYHGRRPDLLERYPIPSGLIACIARGGVKIPDEVSWGWSHDKCRSTILFRHPVHLWF
ncbi:hypothetical protein CONLIGDRAFT_677929 [Coniochaeta ligniaria NRRL 30616]|uniref:Uncharacterized protein n=1 Tax=Coniochaeta ligniaria NRRL 30616 TaxID=1408157 RepID=A0A1J7JLG3_9PEZI|nr:hypothetical protein CONLIGDRAFT_677929 [Coniochaeta ligniaria NRRL 30616]